MKSVLTLLVVTAPIVGQVTSPPGFLNQSGTRPAYLIAGAEARCLYLDGEVGSQARILKDVSWRHGNLNYSSADGMGRSWSQVTVRYAPCDADTGFSRFDQIPISPPVQVFSSSLTLPTVVGYPGSTPANWGTRIPFQSSIAYSGQSDIGLEFEFAGGQLANGAPIGTMAYAVDGTISSPSASGSKISSAGSCSDSAAPFPFIGASAVHFTVFATNHPNASLRDRVAAGVESYHTAPNQPVVHGVGLSQLTPGFALPGLSCAPLFLDFLRPVVLVNGVADLAGTSRIVPPPFPYQSSLSGLPLAVQSMWRDSVTNQPKLTRGMSLVTPSQPTFYRRALLYSLSRANPVGHGPLHADYLNPIFRYGQ